MSPSARLGRDLEIHLGGLMHQVCPKFLQVCTGALHIYDPGLLPHPPLMVWFSPPPVVVLWCWWFSRPCASCGVGGSPPPIVVPVVCGVGGSPPLPVVPMVLMVY